MLDQIQGIHHITAMASDAAANNRFFTHDLGLRRVKQTVNFDAPDVYHLYYGDERGSAGSVMTYFPFPHIAKGRAGTGEVSTTAFAIPAGAIDFWRARLGLGEDAISVDRFGERRLSFHGPDGEQLGLVEAPNDKRAGWVSSGIGQGEAIRGFHSARLRLRESQASEDLLRFMGYHDVGIADGIKRFALDGNGADIIDIETVPNGGVARLGGGSVHHIAFAVADRAAQLEVRDSLLGHGQQVTPVIDRDYFWAIYFRMPGGVLFEIATNEPGFERDEDPAHLGEALKLPRQHEHLRDHLLSHLSPLD